MHTKLALIGTLGLGIAIGSALPQTSENPQTPLLYANHYMQNSAEYRAICLQTYNWAESILRVRARAHQTLQERTPGTKPPCVILDLDETVIDNSPFQTALDQASVIYTPAAWAKWETASGVLELIPGAMRFLEEAKKMGVAIVFISNRNERSREAMITQLTELGIKDYELLLMTNTSDKTARRNQIAQKYEILMLVGDNLRDFSEEFKAPKISSNSDYEGIAEAVRKRKEVVDKNANKFGADYIVLPNPVYGEWEMLKGDNPHKSLRPTKFTLLK